MKAIRLLTDIQELLFKQTVVEPVVGEGSAEDVNGKVPTVEYCQNEFKRFTSRGDGLCRTRDSLSELYTPVSSTLDLSKWQW